MQSFILRRPSRNRELFCSGTFDGGDARYFEGVASLQDDETGKWIRSLDTPDRGEHAARVISDANPVWSAMLRDTISPTMLSAGVRANVIPAEAPCDSEYSIASRQHN